MKPAVLLLSILSQIHLHLCDGASGKRVSRLMRMAGRMYSFVRANSEGVTNNHRVRTTEFLPDKATIYQHSSLRARKVTEGSVLFITGYLCLSFGATGS